MDQEQLKQLLGEGVVLDESNLSQLADAVKAELLKQKVALGVDKDGEITALNEAHAKALEEANSLADERLEEAVEIAIGQYIAENESKFVETEKFAKLNEAFDAFRKAFEIHGFALNENARADELQKALDEAKAEQSSLYERLQATKTELNEAREELQTAKRAIIFDEVTKGLTDTQREKVGNLSESVSFDNLEEFAAGLKLIVEMQSKPEVVVPATPEVPVDENLNVVDTKTEPAALDEARVRDFSIPLHKLTPDERMARYSLR